MMQKKVLIYSHTALWQVHHAETLELAWRHYSSGDKVCILYCTGALTSCPANPSHRKTICGACVLHSAYSRHVNFPPGTDFQTLALDKRFSKSKILDFADQNDFENYAVEGTPFGQLALSQLIDDASDISIPLETLNGRGKELIKLGLALFDAAQKHITEQGIDVVYTWNGRRASDGPVYYAAKKTAKQAFCYISGIEPSKILTFQGPVHDIGLWRQSQISYKRKFLETPATIEPLEKLAKKFFTDLEFGTSEAPGFKWFGQKFATGFLPVNLKRSKQLLVVFTSSIWEMMATPSRTEVPVDFQDPYLLIERLCEDTRLNTKYTVVVRWHPHLTQAGKSEKDRFTSLARVNGSVTHILPESVIDSYELMRSASVVLTMGSTMGVEASYNQVPSILAGSAVFSGLDCVYEPTTYEELVGLILSEPKPLSKLGSIFFGAWSLQEGLDREFVVFNRSNGRYELSGRALFPLGTFLRSLISILNSTIAFLRRS